jgi:hypothetical protein
LPIKKNLLARGGYDKNMERIMLFRESDANLPLMGGFGSKNRNLRGFYAGKEVP